MGRGRVSAWFLPAGKDQILTKHVERKMNILIVDDAPDNLMLLEAILETEGFNSIVLAESAQEAYEKLFALKGEAAIDLILMDIMMPDISGIEAIKEIRSKEEYQDIPILVVSARSETNALVEAFDAGAVDYLTKPINELELIARIRSMLRLKSETDHRKFHEEELEDFTRLLERKNKELQRILDELNNDLEAAGKMQRSLLPEENIRRPDFNISWYFEPCATIGGDLLNVVPLSERVTSFFIMDVSGHGIQSAMLAVSAHRMLSAWGGENSIIRRPDGLPRTADRVVNELNREFLIQKNNFQYFTMIYGLLDSDENTLSYCRAGHTPLIIQKPSGDIVIKEEGNIPVGLTEDGNYDEYKLALEPGDRIILYSDGITEARFEGEFFGEERFYQLVKESSKFEVKKAVDHVVAGVKSWLGDEPPADDITLMIIEFTGKP
ncbi:MAG: phosphoserine phosphatase RsbU/P [Clostridiales bacterium]|nr:phosphoserine phosphatase RsbU/P [Clostridiales bacterium]MDN5281579.1 phosphoserine phosphatase RsbU/P [Candidatus Ozemobacter sp.]